jgi:hypothetical protein
MGGRSARLPDGPRGILRGDASVPVWIPSSGREACTQAQWHAVRVTTSASMSSASDDPAIMTEETDAASEPWECPMAPNAMAMVSTQRNARFQKRTVRPEADSMAA